MGGGVIGGAIAGALAGARDANCKVETGWVAPDWLIFLAVSLFVVFLSCLFYKIFTDKL